jgi:hypothetical protein
MQEEISGIPQKPPQEGSMRPITADGGDISH